MSIATTNACKVCAPLGASLVFRGIERAMPILHGSQGCSTYIRRYIISHFREPIDVASSNFSEHTAIFGGEKNLHAALDNIIAQYAPALIGVATTCLSETIGEDVPAMLRHYRGVRPDAPPLVQVSTPSYRGTHADGFWAAVHAVATTMAESSSPGKHINLLPGMVSPADLRYLKEICDDFGLPAVVLPDYSDTLDGAAWEEYQTISPGGTEVAALRSMGSAVASVEFGSTRDSADKTAAMLEARFGVKALEFPLPIGVRASDAFFAALEEESGRPMPPRHAAERGRLIDAYVDAHKYLFGRRAVLYGEEDLVVSLAAFLAELGMVPALCASGGQSGRMEDAILEAAPSLAGRISVREGVDFDEIASAAEQLSPELLIGSSKGYSLARRLRVPLVRVGFPIHDRFGGQRLLHVGYRGAQSLLDRIVNVLLERKQDESTVGFSYL